MSECAEVLRDKKLLLTQDVKTAFALLSQMSKTEYEEKQQSLGLEVPVKGVPLSLSWEDASQWMQDVKTRLSVSSQSQEQISILTSEADPSSLDAYIACVSRDKEGLFLWVREHDRYSVTIEGLWRATGLDATSSAKMNIAVSAAAGTVQLLPNPGVGVRFMMGIDRLVDHSFLVSAEVVLPNANQASEAQKVTSTVRVPAFEEFTIETSDVMDDTVYYRAISGSESGYVSYSFGKKSNGEGWRIVPGSIFWVQTYNNRILYIEESDPPHIQGGIIKGRFKFGHNHAHAAEAADVSIRWREERWIRKNISARSP